MEEIHYVSEIASGTLTFETVLEKKLFVDLLWDLNYYHRFKTPRQLYNVLCLLGRKPDTSTAYAPLQGMLHTWVTMYQYLLSESRRMKIDISNLSPTTCCTIEAYLVDELDAGGRTVWNLKRNTTLPMTDQDLDNLVKEFALAGSNEFNCLGEEIRYNINTLVRRMEWEKYGHIDVHGHNDFALKEMQEETLRLIELYVIEYLQNAGKVPKATIFYYDREQKVADADGSFTPST